MSPRGLLAVIIAESVKAVDSSPPLQIRHEPEAADETRPANPYHCGIYGVPTEDDMKAGRSSVLIAIMKVVSNHWFVGEL